METFINRDEHLNRRFCDHFQILKSVKVCFFVFHVLLVIFVILFVIFWSFRSLATVSAMDDYRSKEIVVVIGMSTFSRLYRRNPLRRFLMMCRPIFMLLLKASRQWQFLVQLSLVDVVDILTLSMTSIKTPRVTTIPAGSQHDCVRKYADRWHRRADDCNDYYWEDVLADAQWLSGDDAAIMLMIVTMMKALRVTRHCAWLRTCGSWRRTQASVTVM